MPRRKNTRNSHHGCLQCKRRGVKCDERRPQCTKCEDRLEACQYESSGSWLWTVPAAAQHKPTQYSEVEFCSPLSSSDYNVTDASRMVHISPVFTGDTEDLCSRLFVHWKTTTAPSISRNNSDLQIWQTVVPNEAKSNRCLLHGIFAVSAIHLALINPQDTDRAKWIKVAEEHQSTAIGLFTSTMEDRDKSSDVSNFLLSSLLIGFAFAFPVAVSGPSQEISDPLGELLQIISLVKSTMRFSAPLLTDTMTKEMIMLTYVEDSSPTLSDSSRSAILKLYELINTSVSNVDQNAFRSTIHPLEHLFATLDSGAEPVSKAFMWISELDSWYLDLLNARHTFALVIFAHYCVVLHRLRWLWWISSWGQRVLSVLSRELDSEWKPLIAWSLQATGLEGLGT
ncbi:unnamed protein product [Penicillium salamii]|uniref:Zn(2)-C6 fungal-type domain-containing protein n=1 Tax=Penicillium salamii TaxID=1612424 RepID=A0A9W4NHY5_9EURO|nr:unnamed protein product [Penicillium salamii]CAG8356363.1 unnamed protein product [Penicillium salamii]CAG8368981.1 unnamed protein product [Penicillium salamii]CAG8394147.1 unnamed protein product [Penicillium salamii]